MKKIVFLASGNGGNLKFFFLALKYGLMEPVELTVIADRECGSIKFAREVGLNNQLLSYSRSSPQLLRQSLERLQPDVIITNWYKIIDERTVRNFEGKLINLHYSLLPSFGGVIGTEPIKQALAQGCKYIGVTCHMVNKDVDSGDIIYQAICHSNQSFEDIVNELFRKGCLILLASVESVAALQRSKFESISADIAFSPPLPFDVSMVSEEFWKELKAL